MEVERIGAQPAEREPAPATPPAQAEPRASKARPKATASPADVLTDNPFLKASKSDAQRLMRETRYASDHRDG